MRLNRVIDDQLIKVCTIACAVGLGGFLFWAGVAPLDEGVVAAGQIVVRGDRKEIAHFEGGIVREIHVSEGDEVREGDRLITLEPVQSEAARDEIAQELLTAQAEKARLDALRKEREPSFDLDPLGLDPSIARNVAQQQQRLFEEQRATYRAELQVLETRLQSAQGRSNDLEAQIAATEKSLAVSRDELALKRQSLREQLETVANVQVAERQVLSLEAVLARLTSERNLAQRQSQEAADQIAELATKNRRTIEEEAAQAAQKILSFTERLEANEDRLSRTVLTAPLSGKVLGLKANTIGGVVTPGEKVMEIVPMEGNMIALLRLPPTDREAVRPGQEVRAQLSAYKQYRVPRIAGEVLSVSADLKQNEMTGESFYEARVLLDVDTLRGLPQVELVPGLPVEAFVASGRTRTFLDYVMEPIASTVRRGLSFN
ncbi:MAG: HlyD family type I secretion periplasmic adaptor subunit [Parvularcula sp.]|jgi:HlyD family secretion protein/epimerase transport system membrane fusion protein|nr:HlyD family type I secretion periplasmic adaptor subunit [Parvularcula sp.]